MSKNLEEEFVWKSVETRNGLDEIHCADRSSWRHTGDVMFRVCPWTSRRSSMRWGGWVGLAQARRPCRAFDIHLNSIRSMHTTYLRARTECHSVSTSTYMLSVCV